MSSSVEALTCTRSAADVASWFGGGRGGAVARLRRGAVLGRLVGAVKPTCYAAGRPPFGRLTAPPCWRPSKRP